MKEFSVIVPTKNIPDLLDRLLSTIPIREDLEVIVVDDNSSPEKIDFEHYPTVRLPNLKLIRTYEGRGAGYARNQGLMHATGKWLIFADSDDMFNESFNSLLNDYVDSDADIVFFDVDSKYSDTLKPSDRNELLSDAISKAVKTGSTDFLRYSNACYTPWGKMIRRSVVVENDIKFDEVIAANDLMFSIKCGHFARKILVDTRKSYCITTRRGSLWQNRSSAVMRSRMGAWCRANDFMYKNGNLEYRKNLFTLCHVYMRYNRKDYFWAIGQAFKHTPFFRVIPDFIESLLVIIKRLLAYLFSRKTRTIYKERQKLIER